eukprot:TRINITY_DN43404_c0_g1_i1.p1 TRINITY_DN43404_c0_g1~~TRINITY_DN43404_c0_g1_i1.p1  ORF type:complete len:198 (-),score=78.65 TRINITY_DN43404_c0_g1_i1:55-648(-)
MCFHVSYFLCFFSSSFLSLLLSSSTSIFFFLMIRRPPRSTLSSSSAASDVYKRQGKKGEGTFSEVLKAQDIKSNKMVAIKCMKNHFDDVNQVNRLREIQALRRLAPHANIIKLHEVLYDRSTGRLALVFELMDMNIYELIRGRRQYLPDDKVLHYMYQMLSLIHISEPTRLLSISYAVFCLKKKKKTKNQQRVKRIR